MKPQDLVELTELRTETSKHFDNGDGTKRAELHFLPIHYNDDDGLLQDIKTDLVTDTSNSAYTQIIEEHELKLGLIDTFDQPTLYWRKGYPELSITPVGGNSVKGQVTKGSTFYENAYFGADVEQRVTLAGVKEYITLKDKHHPKKLEYFYDTTLTPTIVDNQILFMLDDEMVYRISPLFEMREDRFGNPQFQWIIDEKKNTLYIELPEFDSYPVIIDPTISPYSSSGDGWARKSNSTSWATTVAQGATGSSADYTGNTGTVQVYGPSGGGNKYCDRIFMIFDLTSISGATVTSATVNINNSSKGFDGAGMASQDFGLYESTIASDTVIATTDFGAFGTTQLATSLTYASVTPGSYSSWTLNSSGLTYATGKAGSYAKFCIRLSYDYNGTDPGTTEKYTYAIYNTSEATGTSSDPYMDVTYTAGASFVARPNLPISQTIKRASTI